MSNLTLQILTSVGLLVHIAILVWAIQHRATKSAALLNFILACAVIGKWLGQLPQILSSGDYQVMALLGFEFVTALTSMFALRETRVSRILVWLEFSVHFLFVAAMVAFAFTFKITRLM